MLLKKEERLCWVKTWKIRFEGKANNSRTKRDGKEILDMSFGIYYDTISEAAESLGIKRTTLSAKLVGRRINNTNINTYNMEMADEIIKARVWWKVDSEANWNANDLILGPGEPAWVVNTLDQGVNVKVGNGEKKFSELPYFYRI
ncbi:hypothetical protein [Sphingobacterium sp. ML3W]|uniref:hypothetical protein n=1 Tax=Sphingobacterium sp. ML3W TaxID=1538644 RepID=UPI00300B92CE